MDIIVEKLSKKDLKDAINIYDENHNTKTNYDKLIRNFDKIDKNENYHNIVAKLDNKIVGMATVIKNYDIVEELKPFLTVWNLGVHKDYRRMKIGTKMLDYIYEYAKQLDCSFVGLLTEKDNKAAQLFYENSKYSKIVGYVRMIEK